MFFFDFDEQTITDTKAKIGELTAMMRKNSGLSQGELAVQLAVSRFTITNLESGKNVTIDTLLKVFRHFGALDRLGSFIQQLSEEQNIKPLY